MNEPMVKDDAWDWFQKVTATFPLDAASKLRAFDTAWELAGAHARQEAWKDWVRRAMARARSKARENPSGLFLKILDDGPDLDLSVKPVEKPRDRDAEQQAYRDEMRSWKEAPKHINPPLEEGRKLYARLKDELGPEEATRRVREFCENYPQPESGTVSVGGA